MGKDLLHKIFVSLRGMKLYAKSFQVNDMLMKTYLPTLKTQVVNLDRDAKDLSCDLQRLEVRSKLGSKTLYSAHSWKSYPKYFVLLSHYIKKLSPQV